MVARATSRPGVTETKLSRYLSKTIAGLEGTKSQREIAADLGYEKSNIISMFKSGEAKVPLDKLPALARSLSVDLGFLLRLGLEQYFKNDNHGWTELNRALDRSVSENELEIVRYIREVSNETNPRLDEDRKHALRAAFSR
ncbi:MAG TPA: hypothetical protein VGN75_18685 [Kaistia sp.]|jgi:transcriptional regulator with XRE-family HTH domain|nr:hypothetical protein [Kaistia sp.]